MGLDTFLYVWIMDKRDIVLKVFFQNGVRTNVIASRIQVVFALHYEGQKIESEDINSIIRQLLIDDFIDERTGFFVPTAKLQQVYKAGGFKKYDEIKDAEEANRKKKEELEVQNIAASINISRTTKIIGIVTAVCLVFQLAVSILQLQVSDRQEQLQQQQYKDEARRRFVSDSLSAFP